MLVSLAFGGLILLIIFIFNLFKKSRGKFLSYNFINVHITFFNFKWLIFFLIALQKLSHSSNEISAYNARYRTGSSKSAKLAKDDQALSDHVKINPKKKLFFMLVIFHARKISSSISSPEMNLKILRSGSMNEEPFLKKKGTFSDKMDSFYSVLEA